MCLPRRRAAQSAPIRSSIRGTFVDVGFDFREVGLLAGRLAGDLLNGVDPATVPIGETAREIPPRLTVNLLAAGVEVAAAE